MSLSIGDRVKFRAGRGYSAGTVANVSESSGMVLINTDNAKSVNRKLSQVQRVEVKHPATEEKTDA